MGAHFLHYFLHLVFPVFIALLFFRKSWKKAYLIMLLSMLVDLDHLLVSPIFDPGRCSINFHPLHTYPAMIAYALLFLIPRFPTRVLSIGLLFHMLTDAIDCFFQA